MLKIGLDAMGGDFAPLNAVLGAIDASAHKDIQSWLFGDKEIIHGICNNAGCDPGSFVMVDGQYPLYRPPGISIAQEEGIQHSERIPASRIRGYRCLCKCRKHGCDDDRVFTYTEHDQQDFPSMHFSGTSSD